MSHVTPPRIAVLVKQVPLIEDMRLGPDGRLLRAGVELEMNPLCRRAVATATDLAHAWGGSCTVFTLGPPEAQDCLREAVAWGVGGGVLVSDPRFAGSDTYATAKALTAALRRTGPFDLVLTGRNSVDADTGQVGPQLAELLGWPFLGGVRELQVTGRSLRVRCEQDDGWMEAEVDLPVVMSCAERLCAPAKVDLATRAAVRPERIRTLSAAELGPGPWGAAASLTRVGEVTVQPLVRAGLVLDGSAESQVRRAFAILGRRNAFDLANPTSGAVPVAGVPADTTIAVVEEPDRRRELREMLGAAATMAEQVGATVVAVASERTDLGELSSWGADEIVRLTGSSAEEDVASVVADWCRVRRPWGVLVAGSMWGREVAARVSMQIGAGLTGDAVDLEVGDGRLVAWKPAFGGQLFAAIHADSSTHIVTVRPGALPVRRPRASAVVPVRRMQVERSGRIRVLDRGREDDLGRLSTARVVVGVGVGVAPEHYPLLQPLLDGLGAELAATRKVADRGWQPRSRQIGITGRSIAPALYIAIGLGGKQTHMIGVSRAGTILAITDDRTAPVVAAADVSIVANWHDVVPLLTAELYSPGARSAAG